MIAPPYNNDLLMVSDNLRDWNAFQPPFFTDRQMPKQVSMKIANMAKYIIGITGESTAQSEATIIIIFCLITPGLNCYNRYQLDIHMTTLHS